MEVRGLRRSVKNVAHNYTDTQRKVREATSNDPWGPSTTIMNEIADLSYNIEAFPQIMQMLWKRVNDSGKNWRHVYKALVMLDYLVRTGAERVAQQCKENIFAIQTLKDFQHYEDGKDQGVHIREKAKALVALLTTPENLKTEREKALKARQRFAQTISGYSSSGETSAYAIQHQPVERSRASSARQTTSPSNPEMENARPRSLGEEEIQLQLALAMSKEEAEQEEIRRKNDDLRLQMALSQSEHEVKAAPPPQPKENTSALVDLLDLDLGGASAYSPPGSAYPLPGLAKFPQPYSQDPWGSPPQPQQPVAIHAESDPWLIPPPQHSNKQSSTASALPIDPWETDNSSQFEKPKDPWSISEIETSHKYSDPWNSKAAHDPWSSNGTGASGGNDLTEEDEFSTLSKRMNDPPNYATAAEKTPTEFLGENSGLVNLNNLLPTYSSAVSTNPFGIATAPPQLSANPFYVQNNTAPKQSINEMRQNQLVNNSQAQSQLQSTYPPIYPPQNSSPWTSVSYDKL